MSKTEQTAEHVVVPINAWHLLAFFVASFILTWSAWYAWANLTSLLRWPIFYLGVFAPGIVAMVLTWHEGRIPALRALLVRLIQWRVAVHWYLLAIGFFAAIKLMAALLHGVIFGIFPESGDDPWPLLFAAAAFSTLIGGQAGEELGWRGYALPRLASYLGLAGASLVLGLVWALWHLPLFFLPGTDTTGQSFPVYTLQVIALSVAIAWLYVRTRGSLLLVMLLHAAINNTAGIVPSGPSPTTDVFSLEATPMSWIVTALLWMVAMIFLYQLRRSAVHDIATHGS